MLVDDELWKRIIERCKTGKKESAVIVIRRILKKLARFFYFFKISGED